MLIPSLPHIHFFHFSDKCYLGFNGSAKFLESTTVFDSFLEDRSSTGSRISYVYHGFSKRQICLKVLLQKGSFHMVASLRLPMVTICKQLQEFLSAIPGLHPFLVRESLVDSYQ
jgi:hypothetical protein